jgi:hypothetical protein
MNRRHCAFGREARHVLLAALAAGAAFALAGADARAEGPPPLPPEAYSACASKSEGDACVVQLRGETLAGTCTPHPADGRLFCRLQSPPGPPPTDDLDGGWRRP